MNTPIRDFVLKYAESEKIRLHMPGHKGKSFLGVEKYDITEIDGADVLYNAKGIIKESEENASVLFSSYRTFYSTEGSSLCIKAMLALIASSREDFSRKTRIIAARNAHKAFVYGCAVCDIDVEWIYPEKNEHLCSCAVASGALEAKIKSLNGKADAVYITSPDYLGQLADIEALSAVCDKYDIPLLVDNAHGAYLAFLNELKHPINQGAFMCCDSAHKTLPVFTGGAYLHLSEKAKHLACLTESMMSVMGSTSPSYLILQSLDVCNRYLSDSYRERLADTVDRVSLLKDALCAKGYEVLPSEPLKLVLDAVKSGFDSNDAVVHLRKNRIEPEFYDKDYIVMMFTCENEEEDFLSLSEALSSYDRKNAGITERLSYAPFKTHKAMGIREAVFSRKEIVSVDKAVGRICASPTVSCPPAVPIVVSGEAIDADAVRQMLYYGFDTVEVVKE